MGHLLTLICFLATATGVLHTTSAAAPSPKTIHILQIVEHPSLDDVRRGMQAVVHGAPDLSSQVRFEYSNAQGNFAVCSQIGRKIIGQRPAAVVAIGTQAAQAVITRNRSIPVLFAPITDPVQAKLVSSLAKPGGIATGVSDKTPMSEHIKLIRTMMPHAKRIGIVYNAGEANSQTIAAQFREEATVNGLVVVDGVAQSTAMVMSVVRSLTVDALFVPNDNTVASAIESVFRISQEKNIPVFVSDRAHLEKGALAGLAVDYHEVGKMLGDMLANVLRGKSPAAMPVQSMKNPRPFVNEHVATRFGIQSGILR